MVYTIYIYSFIQFQFSMTRSITSHYSAFLKTPTLLKLYHQIIYRHIEDTSSGGSCTFEEMQLVYSTARADWALFKNYQPKF